jgi:acylpyruvate hydrolase
MSEQKVEFDFKIETRKVIGIIKNFKQPNKEYAPLKEDDHLLIFGKPSTAIHCESDGAIRIPKGWPTINHEVELGVVIGKDCKHVSEQNALDYVLGYCLALDMTASLDMEKYSMFLLKGFDTSCPVSQFIQKNEIENPDDVNLELRVNGELRQKSNTSQMIVSVSRIISYLSKYFKLEYGDLILTGTPPGISTVKAGDVIEAKLGSDLMNLRFEVVDE